MTLCVSDIHGCYYTLIRLLNKCLEGEVIFAGDLIDRGPHSKEVVEFAMHNKIPCVMGNHEDLALAYSKHRELGYKSHCVEMYDRDVWLDNGGRDCLESFGSATYANKHTLPKDVLDWIQALPAYIKRDNLLISHTGYGLSDWFAALWMRHDFDRDEFPDDGLFRVFGHTQQKNAVITNKCAMIDTGAAYSERGMGILTAFEWPSKKVISQEFDEKPVMPNFEIKKGVLTKI